MPSIRQPILGPTHVHGAIQNPKATNNYLPSPISLSTPASISSISPQSSSDLDTNHGDKRYETIKQVTHTINQILLTLNTCNTSTNKVSNDPHDNIPDLQPTQDVNLHTTHTYKHTVNKHKQNTPTQGQHYTLNYNV